MKELVQRLPQLTILLLFALLLSTSSVRDGETQPQVRCAECAGAIPVVASTPTPTVTPTWTDQPTLTPTQTFTATVTPTFTITATTIPQQGSTATPTFTPTPTNTFTNTPTATPTTTPDAPTCPYRQLDFTLIDGTDMYVNGVKCSASAPNPIPTICPAWVSNPDPIDLTERGDESSCVDDLEERMEDICDKIYPENDGQEWEEDLAYQDQCPFLVLALLFDDSTQTDAAIIEKYKASSQWQSIVVPTFRKNGTTNNEVSGYLNNNPAETVPNYNTDSVKYTFYMYVDSNCKRVPNLEGQNLYSGCKLLTVEDWVSPLSLLLEDEGSFGKEVSFVNFPLDPHASDMWYVWKASGKAPLLVFTPNGERAITSAAQLFGEWTFGGKSVAAHQKISLDGAPQSTERREKWANAYEALATLDTNNDGEISGAELTVLSLWFDSNTDGVSQPGEVVAITESGVDKLFYQGSTPDTTTNSQVLDLGFSRVVNGVRQTGRTVDWYAQSASSKEKLIEKLLVNADMCGQINGYGGDPKAQPRPNDSASASSLDSKKPSEAPQQPGPTSTTAKMRPPLAGLWQWQMVAPAGQNETSGGMFVFTTSPDGALVGRSIVEAKFKPYAVPGVAAQIVSPQLGDIQLEPDPSGSGRRVSFTSQTRHGIITNTATISGDGKTMNGVSSVKLSRPDGVELSFKYDWQASKIDQRAHSGSTTNR